MSDYTPSTSTVRQAWYEAPYNGGGGREMSDAELDRWLESIRAEAAKRFPDDGEQIVRYVIQRARSAYVDGYLAAAAVLPEVERRAKADILREAADDVRTELGNETSGHTSTYSVRRWLTARADQIEKGDRA